MSFKILIVDDAGFIRQILGSLLQELGCQIIGEARTGNEAVLRAQALRPDLIFMDMVLPEKNGAEASIEILEEFPKTLIVAMSTATEDIVRERALQAGCVRFMAKPFQKESLRQLLKELSSTAPHFQQGAS